MQKADGIKTPLFPRLQVHEHLPFSHLKSDSWVSVQLTPLPFLTQNVNRTQNFTFMLFYSSIFKMSNAFACSYSFLGQNILGHKHWVSIECRLNKWPHKLRKQTLNLPFELKTHQADWAENTSNRSLGWHPSFLFPLQSPLPGKLGRKPKYRLDAFRPYFTSTGIEHWPLVTDSWFNILERGDATLVPR